VCLPSPSPLSPHLNNTLLVDIVRLLPSVVSCLGSPLHLLLQYATARISYTRSVSTHVSKGLIALLSTKNEVAVCACLLITCLPTCLPVADTRLFSPTVNPDNTITPTTFSIANKIPNSTSPRRATTPPPQQHLHFPLLSPPATPRRVDSPILVRSPIFNATMNRSALHGAPARSQVPSPRGPARGLQSAYGHQDAQSNQPAYGNQDARSNLAVQPAANAGSLKLKKTAVKIVSAPASISPFQAASAGSITTPVAGSSPSPGPLKTKPKDVDRYVNPALLW
jgi:hypothetical protein